ncbi:hypothetical protein, partial [Streptomyces sp. NPDC006996]|uniref:hypothetical protein n=1 Tax=Streptomyces sp. NPDC006996 TaxID=3156908 RepID=UPI0033F24B5C
MTGARAPSARRGRPRPEGGRPGPGLSARSVPSVGRRGDRLCREQAGGEVFRGRTAGPSVALGRSRGHRGGADAGGDGVRR